LDVTHSTLEVRATLVALDGTLGNVMITTLVWMTTDWTLEVKLSAAEVETVTLDGTPVDNDTPVEREIPVPVDRVKETPSPPVLVG
jgi:hypothetical protein